MIKFGRDFLQYLIDFLHQVFLAHLSLVLHWRPSLFGHMFCPLRFAMPLVSALGVYFVLFEWDLCSVFLDLVDLYFY